MDARQPPNLGYANAHFQTRPHETTLDEREKILAARERKAVELDRELEERRQDLEVLEMQLADRGRELDKREAAIVERERSAAAGADSTVSSPRSLGTAAELGPRPDVVVSPAANSDEPERMFAVDAGVDHAAARCEEQTRGTEKASIRAGCLQRSVSDVPVGPGEELTLEPDVLGALRGGKLVADSGKSVRFVEPAEDDPLGLPDSCPADDTGSVAASAVGSFAGSVSSSACLGPGRASGMRTKRLTARKRVAGSDASLLSGGTVSSTTCSDETTAELGGG